MSTSYTPQEVAKHATEQDCWIIVKDQVFNVTGFLSDHPGGKKILLRVAGQDATKEFDKFHNAAVLAKYSPKLLVGSVQAKAPLPAPSTSLKQFGEQVPYGDPSWYQGWNSPYYTDSHRKWRAAIRTFVDSEIMPFCHEWDEAKGIPRSIWRKCAQAGWLPGVVGHPWPTQHLPADYPIAGGILPSEFDAFHELVLIDEVARCGSVGVLWGLYEGLQIGLPPIIQFGTPKMHREVVQPCLLGEAVVCLCITEPGHGSDVANLTTEAKKTADGRHFVVNGAKKWITNGVFADFFTVAVRTGQSGMKGVSLLLMDRNMPGLTTRQMQCSGVWASGTTYITFEDVLVPVENLIGKENEGFLVMMNNFNHERLGFIGQASRFSRVLLEESLKYANKRKTFGKKLMEHTVIRQKLALMTAKIECVHAAYEHMVYQTQTMTRAESNVKLGGAIALLKAQASQTMEFCAREAAQIFGGLSYSRGGQGEKIERLYREVRAIAIPGGSEEIMLDLGMRQIMKAPALAKL